MRPGGPEAWRALIIHALSSPLAAPRANAFASVKIACADGCAVVKIGFAAVLDDVAGAQIAFVRAQTALAACQIAFAACEIAFVRAQIGLAAC